MEIPTLNALSAMTWFIAGVGLLLDLYQVTLVLFRLGSSKSPSTVPIVGALLYLLSVILRRGLGLSPHWLLFLSLLSLHLLWHFGAVPWFHWKRRDPLDPSS